MRRPEDLRVPVWLASGPAEKLMDANPRHAQILRNLETLPHTNLAEAAAALAVPEAVLVHIRRSPDLVRLKPDWPALFGALKSLGSCTLQLRASAGVQRAECAIAHTGITPSTTVLHSDLGLAELRVLHPRLGSVWAVCAEGHAAGPMGIRVFDRHGNLAFEFLHGNQTDRAAFARLVSKLRANDQNQDPPCAPAPMALANPEPPKQPEALVRAWAGLRDAKHILRIQRQFGVDRLSLYRALDPSFTTPLHSGGLRDMLERCVHEELRVALSVGNRAAVQVHTGIIERVAQMGRHLTITEPTFFLLHDERSISSLWIVRRPDPLGLRTSIEALSPSGDVLLSLRSPAVPDVGESWRWRRALEHSAHQFRAR